MLDAEGDHRFENFSIDGATAERKGIASQLLGNAARPFPGRTAQDVANEGTANPVPIDAIMFKKAAVFAYKQSVDEST